MSRLFSIDPVGILKACTTNVRMNSARMTAMTIDSKYSRTVDFLKVSLAIGSDFKDGEKRLLRDLHAADLLHPLLAFLLLFEQLALARDVAAVALGEDVLAQRLYRLAGDHAPADRRLNRDLEHLARDQLAHFRCQRPAALVG